MKLPIYIGTTRSWLLGNSANQNCIAHKFSEWVKDRFNLYNNPNFGGERREWILNWVTLYNFSTTYNKEIYYFKLQLLLLLLLLYFGYYRAACFRYGHPQAPLKYNTGPLIRKAWELRLFRF
jgi:hypothetical protein